MRIFIAGNWAIQPELARPRTVPSTSIPRLRDTVIAPGIDSPVQTPRAARVRFPRRLARPSDMAYAMTRRKQKRPALVLAPDLGLQPSSDCLELSFLLFLWKV